MAKQRKSKPQKQSPSKVEEIPEDEQWKIIEKSGVLKNIPRSAQPAPSKEQTEEEVDEDLFSPICNEIFNAILFIIPFSSLYIMMDILAHRQYGHTLTGSELLENLLYGIPALSIFIFYTIRYKTDRRLQALLFLLSVGCGSRLVYIINKAGWLVVMKQAPPLGTIWVYTIAQIDLLPAVVALGLVGGYVKWNDYKIIF